MKEDEEEYKLKEGEFEMRCGDDNRLIGIFTLGEAHCPKPLTDLTKIKKELESLLIEGNTFSFESELNIDIGESSQMTYTLTIKPPKSYNQLKNKMD